MNLDFNSLRFGAGTLVLEEQESGQSSGSLGGTGWSLNLQGWSTMGKPMTVRFQGAGEIGGENWVYDFLRGLLLSNVAKWNKSNTSISWHNRSHLCRIRMVRHNQVLLPHGMQYDNKKTDLNHYK